MSERRTPRLQTNCTAGQGRRAGTVNVRGEMGTIGFNYGDTRGEYFVLGPFRSLVVIFSTSALCSGVNTPHKRVVSVMMIEFATLGPLPGQRDHRFSVKPWLITKSRGGFRLSLQRERRIEATSPPLAIQNRLADHLTCEARQADGPRFIYVGHWKSCRPYMQDPPTARSKQWDDHTGTRLRI
jgi:hypothetical protein